MVFERVLGFSDNIFDILEYNPFNGAMIDLFVLLCF